MCHLYCHLPLVLVCFGAVLQAARKMDAPIMIQFSAGGSQFYAGKGLDTLLQMALGSWIFRRDLV